MALMLSAGELSSYDEVAEIITPNGENRHVPVPHTRLVDMTRSRLELNGWEIVDEKYGLSNPKPDRVYKGARPELRNNRGMNMWFQFEISKPEVKDWSFAPVIAGRNSHIQDFSQHLLMGTNMFVCSNGMFSAECEIRAKHTREGSVNADARVTSIIEKIMSWAQHTKDAYSAYKDIPMSESSCITTMWGLYENKALDLGMLPIVKNEFINPRHEEFEGQNLFSFANACTEAMKRSPSTIQNKSLRLTDKLNQIAGIEDYAEYSEE